MIVERTALALALALAGCEGDPPAPAAPEAPRPEAVDPPAEPEPPADWIDVDASSLAERLRERPEPVLLVNVWSTWCQPCVEEMPDVIATARRYEARGLGLVLIAAEAPRNRDAALAFLREQGAPLPSWFKRGSDDAFVRALHPPWTGSLPATFLLDRERRVVHFWSEPVSSSVLSDPIDALLTSTSGEGT